MASTEDSSELGGHEHEFVDPTHDYECPLCLLVARDPIQTECGHSFCQTCWARHAQASVGPVRCPVDNVTVALAKVFPDRNKDRITRSLNVYCENRANGCEEIRELRNIEKHQKTCQYQMKPCHLSCGQSMLLWSLAAHVTDDCPKRSVNCETCKAKLMAMDLRDHLEVCPMERLACEYCKVGGILRMNLETHHKTKCPKYPTFCNFALLGCSEKVVRSELKTHCDSHTQTHVYLLNRTLGDICNSLGPGLIHQPGAGDRPNELPSRLWGKVPVPVPGELLPNLPGPALPQLPPPVKATLYDRIVKLEEMNAKLLGKIDVMGKSNIKLAEKNAKLADKIDEMAKANSKTTKKVNKLVKDVEGVDGKVNKIEVKRGEFNRGEIREGECYQLPCVWAVELEKGVDVESPSFFTVYGYRLRFHVIWDRNEMKIGVGLRKGAGDDKLVWPWNGRNIMVVVRDDGKGKQLAVGDVVVLYDGGRSRPMDEVNGNGHLLAYANVKPLHYTLNTLKKISLSIILDYKK